MKWGQKRAQAEIDVLQKKGPDLYSLEEIYVRIGTAPPCPDDEMEMEQRVCFPVTEGRRLLAAARERGEQVLFVSDMYLSGDFLRHLLGMHGFWQEGDLLYVSHEQGAAKHGGLFQKICQDLSLAPSQILHTGDNFRADVLAPRALGIRTVHFRATEPSRYEIEWSQKGGKDGAAVADALRAARLQFPESLGDREKILWETACGVAAPLFLAYVSWLGQEARKIGLERLYFVSRDGLIFKKIYDVLFADDRTFPRSHYLYGSRQAWSGVRAAFLREDDMEALVATPGALSLRQFYGRCGWPMPPSIQLAWARPAPALDDPLRPEQRRQLAEFMRSGELREAVVAQGERRLREARAFLQQEGLGTGRYGLVDLGWYGNLQSFLERILPENPPVAGFYLELKSNSGSCRRPSRKAFLPFGCFRGIQGSVATTLLEILAAAPHGTVWGYECRNKKWEAVLAEPVSSGGPEQQAWIHHEAILRALEEFRHQGLLQKPGNLSAGVPAILKNLRTLLSHPTTQEAEAYGPFHFTSRQEGGTETEFAPALSPAQAMTMVREGFWSREALWPQACIQRNRGWAGIILGLRFLMTICKEKALSLFASPRDRA